MNNDAFNLLYVLEQPSQPSWFPKNNGQTVFQLPTNFIPSWYENRSMNFSSRFNTGITQRIQIENVETPDLAFTETISRTDAFSTFIPAHQVIAGQLTEIFMKVKDLKTLLSVAVYTRDRVNVNLFQYSFSVALQHRPDTKNLSLPSIVSQFPDEFLDPSVFPKLRDEAKLLSTKRTPVEIPVNLTASDSEKEQRLAYFREDIGINIHHWQWHLIYPGEGIDEVVKKDRRGELFYYMHQQIIARYNVERMSNGIEQVKFLSLDEPIEEAYFPKIIRSMSQRAFPSRVANSTFKDINRKWSNFKVNDLKRFRDRINDAITAGKVIDSEGKTVILDEVTGIDILGNMIEPTKLSINSKFYGNLHGFGHEMIAYIHDPDGRHLEDFSVMGSVTTAMRDPVFYRWHGYINSMMERFKDSLPEYPRNQLKFDNVNIDSVVMQITQRGTVPNQLLTYWEKSLIDLAVGADFGSEGKFFASYKHLQHAPFAYLIQVTNMNPFVLRGTCRIFLGPKVDEKGRALTFAQQRVLMIEMDKFTILLKPGFNKMTRHSNDSSTTVPASRSFQAVGAQVSDNARLCRCGWPAHMLLPKGTVSGLRYEVFVMISDYEDDFVEEVDVNQPCYDAHSFCGLKDKKYPDKRAMGFPFDRQIKNTASLVEFAQKYSNMTSGEVTIKFKDSVVS